MKQILNLKTVSVTQKIAGTQVWWIHLLSNGKSKYYHWSKHEILETGISERVIMKIGKAGEGKPRGRMVNIIPA